MTTPDAHASLVEKLNKFLPPLLREAVAILTATGLYIFTTKQELWNWTIIGILLATAISLGISYFAGRRPRFRFHFYWKDFEQISELYHEHGQNPFYKTPPGLKYSHAEKLGRQELHVEISDIVDAHSFIAYTQKTKRLEVGGFVWEEEPIGIIITDLPTEALHSRWIHDFFFRVGYCTEGDFGRFEWFTFCPKRLLDRTRIPSDFPRLHALRRQLHERLLQPIRT